MNNPISPKPLAPWLMLISRSLLFLFFQGVITLILFLAGQSNAWDGSARWWLFSVIAANLVSVILLNWLFKKEGKSYWDNLRFHKATVGKDLLWLLGTSVIGIPIMAAPMNNLAALIFGDPMAPINMMFLTLPTWALALGFLFPLTIPFSELPTYFGYAMPKLSGASEERLGHLADRLLLPGLAALLPALYPGCSLLPVAAWHVHPLCLVHRAGP